MAKIAQLETLTQAELLLLLLMFEVSPKGKHIDLEEAKANYVFVSKHPVDKVASSLMRKRMIGPDDSKFIRITAFGKATVETRTELDLHALVTELYLKMPRVFRKLAKVVNSYETTDNSPVPGPPQRGTTTDISGQSVASENSA